MLRSASAAALLALVATSCGGSSTPAETAAHDRLVAPPGAAARIEVVRQAGAPPVAAVVRNGDPTSAIAVVLLVEDASAPEAPLLAALLEERLRRDGAAAEARIARSAIIVAADLDPRGVARTVSQLRAALTATVRPLAGDALAGVGRRAAAIAGPTPPPGMEGVARCAGWAVEARAPTATSRPIDLATPAGAAEVERLRAASATAARASIAVVGRADAVEIALDALASASAWTPGARLAPAADAMPAAEVFAVQGASDRERPRDLVVAVALPRAAAAPALARSIATPGAALASRLRVLPPELAIRAVSGTARAGGGGSCLRLDLVATRPDALDATSAALAADVVRRALGGDAPSPGEQEIAARSILEAADPREAATRAAWWATTADAPRTTQATTSLALGIAPTAQVESTRAELLRAAGRATTAAAAPRLERRARVEAGQGAFRMLVATPCAPAIDGDVAAAETAIALVAAARRTAERGIELAPFLEGSSAGLSARADARAGESPQELATRVARALARALAADPPSASDLADARFRLVEHASRSFGHAEGADALSHALAPGRPTLMAPLGLEIPLVRADAEGARARLAALLRGPLRAAAIANVDAAQADVAFTAFEDHLPPIAALGCAPGATSAPTPGRADVRVPADEPFAQIAFGLATTSSAAAADVATALLGAPDGPVARAAATVGGSARATRFGDAGVALDVRVSPERAEEALAAVNVALAALSRGEIAEASLREARTTAAEQARARAADPDHRLRTLWRGQATGASGAVDPRAVAAELAPGRWTVVVARPG